MGGNASVGEDGGGFYYCEGGAAVGECAEAGDVSSVGELGDLGRWTSGLLDEVEVC